MTIEHREDAIKENVRLTTQVEQALALTRRERRRRGIYYSVKELAATVELLKRQRAELVDRPGVDSAA